MAETMIVTGRQERAKEGWPAPVGVASGSVPAPALADTPAVGGAGVAVHAGAWVAGLCGAVVLWSVSYLIRQPGLGGVDVQPFSLLGDFALEGAMLALAWLSLVVAGCVALLQGTIVISSPGR